MASMKPNLRSRLVRGGAWALGGKLTGVISSIAVNALLARLLEPDQLGAYFLINSLVLFGAVFARFGMKQTVVRLVAESVATDTPGRARIGLQHVFKIVAAGIVLVGASYYWGLADWLAVNVFGMPLLAGVAGVTVLWMAVLALETPIAETFRGLHKIGLAVFHDGVLGATFLAVALGACYVLGVRVTFFGAIALSAVMAATALLGGFLAFRRNLPLLRGDGTISFGEVLKVSMPMFVTNVANQAMTNSSIWIIGVFADPNTIALYGSAWKLVNVLLLPLMLANMFVVPVISELYVQNDKHRLQRALRATATMLGMPLVILSAPFLIFGGEILTLVYGEYYKDAAVILLILALGQIVNVWTGSCEQLLAYTGHQNYLMAITVVIGAAAVALMILGATIYGGVGVAIAVSTSRVLQNIATWIFAKRLTGIWTHMTIRLDR